MLDKLTFLTRMDDHKISSKREQYQIKFKFKDWYG